jgi:hypothetical protein
LVPEPSFRRRFLTLLVAALLSSSPACRKAAPPRARSLNPEGSLPAGCAVAATVDRVALGQLGEVANALMSSTGMRDAMLTGVDLKRDVRWVRFCRMPSENGRPSKSGSFVTLLSGSIPANALDAAAARSPSGTVKREELDGVPIVGTDRAWVARRGARGDVGELVMSNDRELLRKALFAAPGSYVTEPSAPLSMVMAPSMLAGMISPPEGAGAQPSAMAAVEEVRINLAAGATGLVVHFVVGDQDKAARLAHELAPVIPALVRQMIGARGPMPGISINTSNKDVIARIEIPPGSLDAFAQRIGATRAARARP